MVFGSRSTFEPLFTVAFWGVGRAWRWTIGPGGAQIELPGTKIGGSAEFRHLGLDLWNPVVVRQRAWM